MQIKYYIMLTYMRGLKVKVTVKTFNNANLKRMFNDRKKIIQNQKNKLKKYSIYYKSNFNGKMFDGFSLMQKNGIRLTNNYDKRINENKKKIPSQVEKKLKKKREYDYISYTNENIDDFFNYITITDIKKKIMLSKEEIKKIEEKIKEIQQKEIKEIKEIQQEEIKEMKTELNNELKHLWNMREKTLKENIKNKKIIFVKVKINQLKKKLLIKKEILAKFKKDFDSDKKNNFSFFKVFKKKNKINEKKVNKDIIKSYLLEIRALKKKNSLNITNILKNNFKKEILVELHNEKSKLYKKIKNSKKIRPTLKKIKKKLQRIKEIQKKIKKMQEKIKEIKKEIEFKDVELNAISKNPKDYINLDRFLSINALLAANNLYDVNKKFIIHYYLAWVFLLDNFYKINKKLIIRKNLLKINNINLKRIKYPFFAVFDKISMNKDLTECSNTKTFFQPKFVIKEVIKLTNKLCFNMESIKNNKFVHYDFKEVDLLDPNSKLFFQSYEIILYIILKYGFKKYDKESGYVFDEVKIAISKKLLSAMVLLSHLEKPINLKGLILLNFIDSFIYIPENSFLKVVEEQMKSIKDLAHSTTVITSKEGFRVNMTMIFKERYFNLPYTRSPIFMRTLKSEIKEYFSNGIGVYENYRKLDLLFQYIGFSNVKNINKYWLDQIFDRFLFSKLDKEATKTLFNSYKCSNEQLLLLNITLKGNKKLLNNSNLGNILFNMLMENNAKHNFRTVINFSILFAVTELFTHPFYMDYILFCNYPKSILHDPENFDRNFDLKKAYETLEIIRNLSASILKKTSKNSLTSMQTKFFYEKIYKTKPYLKNNKIKKPVFQYITNIPTTSAEKIIDILTEQLKSQSPGLGNKTIKTYNKTLYQDCKFNLPLVYSYYPTQLRHSIESDIYMVNVKDRNDKKSDNIWKYLSVDLQEKILDIFFKKFNCVDNIPPRHKYDNTYINFNRNSKDTYKMNLDQGLKASSNTSDNLKIFFAREKLLDNMLNKKKIVSYNLEKLNIKNVLAEDKISKFDDFIFYVNTNFNLEEYRSKKKKDISENVNYIIDDHFQLMKKQHKRFFTASLSRVVDKLYFNKLHDRKYSVKKQFSPDHQNDLEQNEFKNDDCNINMVQEIFNNKIIDKIYYSKKNRDLVKTSIDIIKKSKSRYFALEEFNTIINKSFYLGDLNESFRNTLVLDQYFYLKKYNLAFKISLFLIHNDTRMSTLFDFFSIRSYYNFLFNFQQCIYKLWKNSKFDNTNFSTFLIAYLLMIEKLDRNELLFYNPFIYDQMVSTFDNGFDDLDLEGENAFTIKKINLITKKLKYAINHQDANIIHYHNYEMRLITAFKYCIATYVEVIEKRKHINNFIGAFESFLRGLKYQEVALKSSKLGERLFKETNKKIVLQMIRLFLFNHEKKKSKKTCKKVLSKLVNFLDLDINDLKLILSKYEL